MSVSPTQVKVARLLLGWSQDALAGASSVSTSSVKPFEHGRKLPTTGARLAIQLALEAAGVAFVEETDERPGVRLRKAN